MAGVRRKALLLAVLAALVSTPAALPAPAATLTEELMPGVTYTRQVKTIRGEQVVLHVVTGPRPGGGLYRLVPVLSNGTVTGTETLTRMQKRLAGQATVVGVNGDFFSVDLGYPSGIFMRDGVLHGRPYASRSSLGIGSDGVLRIGRAGFSGTWSVGGARPGTLAYLNRPVPKAGAGLFTPSWGDETPKAKNALEVILPAFPDAVPGGDLVGQIVEVRQGGGTPIPAGGAVLQARGSTARRLEARAQPGLPLTARLLLDPWWADVSDAIGGGPALVLDGRIAFPNDEAFSSSQLNPRHPRTAVGQLADGRIVLVAVDGRRSWSAGLDLRDLARELVRLGAVTAIGFDGGGGTTMAFDGHLLNTPSDGRERGTATALMMMYYGVYAPEPSAEVVSPNGDGVAERQTLAYELVRSSVVNVRLVGLGGKVLWEERGQKEPGRYRLTLQGDALEEGKWRWIVSAIDTEGNESRAERRFVVNSTLGFLRLSAPAIRVAKKRPATLRISFETAKRARIAVTVEDRFGRLVRTLLSRSGVEAGDLSVTWNGFDGAGRPAPAATYTIHVHATNPTGPADLMGTVKVERGPR
jgi:hypothetical protein